ncbi:MAG TPA: HAMP domain-containing sensor histidine kinase [Gemmatimonadaceae bacterium]|nr:HAMP domain-containing sensor histidine kinase [Gemmatimonadaceae bacterium]
MVVLTLMGSVLIPARLSWRILGELHRIGELAPLRADVGARIQEIQRLEELSLDVNAALVIVALVATFCVLTLSMRERRRTAEARQRARDEILLREDKVRLLDEARASRTELQRVMQSRSRLMRGFSHDVKNPLGAADGYAQLLAMGVHGALTTAQGESVAGIHRCIQSALALIEDLHQLSRVETGNIIVHKAPTNVPDLLRALRADYDATARTKGLTLTLDVEPEIPDVMTDASRVREIVGNLLSNAIKYTAHGTVTLRSRAVHDADAGAPIVLVQVTDNGPGIPADKCERIFEEFSRLSSEQPGAGLGLAISRLLAQALGAQLSVESIVGSGATFTLSLPMTAVANRASSGMQLQSA